MALNWIGPDIDFGERFDSDIYACSLLKHPIESVNKARENGACLVKLGVVAIGRKLTLSAGDHEMIRVPTNMKDQLHSCRWRCP